MQGRIIKGIAGFYYVHVVGAGVYECKAKGIFRKDKIKPLVGDQVEIDVISEEEMTGNIVKICKRKNELIRPAVANVDQAIIIFAAAKPAPNFNLLNRFLILMEYQQVPVTICFNKSDLVSEEEYEQLKAAFMNTGYEVLFVSAKEMSGIDELRAAIQDKTTTVAGPSGVGKSSLINLLQPEVAMETGDISRKIERGKHTTRHSQLIYVSKDTYIMDTPGFSSILLPEMEKEELSHLFPEFREYEDVCRFYGCSHISEPNCAVKEALAEEKISQVRYDDYAVLYQELKERRKY